VIRRIVWNGSYWIAVSTINITAAPTLYYSSNGTTWERVTNPYSGSGLGYGLTDLVWTGGEWYAGGTERRIITSLDGLNWQSTLSAGSIDPMVSIGAISQINENLYYKNGNNVINNQYSPTSQSDILITPINTFSNQTASAQRLQPLQRGNTFILTGTGSNHGFVTSNLTFSDAGYHVKFLNGTSNTNIGLFVNGSSSLSNSSSGGFVVTNLLYPASTSSVRNAGQRIVYWTGSLCFIY
jgi:hypothetical protein